MIYTAQLSLSLNNHFWDTSTSWNKENGRTLEALIFQPNWDFDESTATCITTILLSKQYRLRSSIVPKTTHHLHIVPHSCDIRFVIAPNLTAPSINRTLSVTIKRYRFATHRPQRHRFSAVLRNCKAAKNIIYDRIYPPPQQNPPSTWWPLSSAFLLFSSIQQSTGKMDRSKRVPVAPTVKGIDLNYQLA